MTTTSIETITKAILATTSVPAEIVQMAYELGISHGRSQLAEERKKPPRKWTWATPADNIATCAKLKSSLEERWFPWLCQHFVKVRYEPRRFVCYAEGKRTTYTPDFLCTPERGQSIWVETKPKDWRAFSQWNASDAMRQLRRMQSTVKHHKILLYVCSGEPDSFDTYQILGLDVDTPDSPETIVKTKLPIK